MRIAISLLLCLALAACAGVPDVPGSSNAPQQLFHDERFAPASERIDVRDIFALSDSMRSYLQKDLAHQLRSKGLQRGLIDALYQSDQLKLEYDAAQTRNAAQAFDARSGNCLSLVIMTAAFAKELGLGVTYESAYLEETWTRAGNLYLRSGHVNVTLGRRLMDFGTGGDHTRFTVDFLPQEDLQGLHTHPIGEDTVIAMFLNNRAAEALVAGRIDDAYWWAREAIAQSPAFMSAFNTLGVVYMRHGDFGAAEQAFAQVLRNEPRNTRAMSNQVQVLETLGRAADARKLREELARIEPEAPFQFFNQGVAAVQRGDLRAARLLFAKEIQRDAYNPEFHFWMSVVDYRLGDLRDAEVHLRLAVENSKSRGAHDIYAAKLAWLKSHTPNAHP